ncbi:MAG TPA: PKD domain-containing protein, partial [Solirubrobacteraceae bacterium]|nr:PKD domain-containing protein [Solirubrobacteraceae bacterium]
ADPQLVKTPEFGAFLPTGALCLHDTNPADGNTVLPHNETFAMTWDPGRQYWETTRGVMETFLRDVADGSGQYTSPFSLTSQYTDATGARAQNSSLYGGGCIDYGNPGGYTCQYGNTTGRGVGTDYPSGDPVLNCSPTGSNALTGANGQCLTDAAVRQEVTFLAATTGLGSHLKSGYDPMLVMLMPPTVEVCLDSSGALCSAGSNATAQFCSYHSYVTVGGVRLPYVVQPWTAYTGCDEQLPALTQPVTTVQLETDAADRMVSALSEGMIASITNPWLDGWFANDGSEVNDNPYLDSMDQCQPYGYKLDTVSVGPAQWVLQREFNNGGTLTLEPNTQVCSQWAVLNPFFVVPSAVDPGDVVQFDGSATNSTEVVPNAGYWWNFGDGTTAIGPSVEHAYAKPGSYTVKLAVVDRGGNVNETSQTMTVLGPSGGGGGGGGGNPGLVVHLKWLPVRHGLLGFLRYGVALRVSANTRADGIVKLVIPSGAARRAHIRVPAGQSSVVIGTGTVAGLIKSGTVTLHLGLDRATAAKLKRTRHLTVTVRLILQAAGGVRDVFTVAGKF